MNKDYIIDETPYNLGKDKNGVKHDVREIHPILLKLIFLEHTPKRRLLKIQANMKIERV